MFGRRSRNYNRGYYQPRQNIALLLLATQLFQVGFTRIPPVTLLTILGQVAIFLRLIPLKYGWPAIREVCISSNLILKNHDFKRLVTATFFHLDDWHLYYNMVSFLWKGMKLERTYGSPYFAYLLAVFTVLTNIVTVAIGVGAADFLNAPVYKQQCAAGFSGVIFALKVITTHNSQGSEYVYGFPVPGPLVCWAELFIIQLITPHASFVGHLAGIIVGLLYVKGPLKSMMDLLIPSRPSYTYRRGTTTGQSDNFWGAATGGGGGRPSTSYPGGTHGGQPSSPSYPSGRSERRQYEDYNAGASWGGASSNEREDRGTSSRGDAYDDYTGGLSEEEQIQRAMEESRRTCETGPSPSPSEPAPAPTLPPSARPSASSPLQPSAPPYVPRTDPPPYEERNRIYPDLRETNTQDNANVNVDELRRRRLAKFT